MTLFRGLPRRPVPEISNPRAFSSQYSCSNFDSLMDGYSTVLSSTRHRLVELGGIEIRGRILNFSRLPLTQGLVISCQVVIMNHSLKGSGFSRYCFVDHQLEIPTDQ